MNTHLSLLLLAGLATFASAATVTDAKPADKPAAPAKPAAKYKVHATIKAARKAAEENKRPVYILFTGAGWCHYCNALEKEILSTKEWKAWAAENLEVHIVASRGGPGNESGEGKKLKTEYAPIKGYPTVILTDASGKAIGRDGGYNPGTKPAEYIKQLEQVIAASRK